MTPLWAWQDDDQIAVMNSGRGWLYVEWVEPPYRKAMYYRPRCPVNFFKTFQDTQTHPPEMLE